MFIETEATPNPATLKFIPGRDVMGERGTHASKRRALERAGFAVEWDRSGATNLGHFFASRES